MFEGEKVRLRPYEMADVDAILKYINDIELRKNLVPDQLLLLSKLEENDWIESANKNKEKEYNFAIELKKTGEYIGGCGYHNVDWKNRNMVIGIFIGKPFWNNGLGTEAFKLLIDYAFEEMNMNKVLLNVYSFNKRAIRSYEKLGFSIEGNLKEQIYRDGKYHEEYIMAILRREWEEKN